MFVSPESALYAGMIWFGLRIAYGIAYRSNDVQMPKILIFTIPCYNIIGYLALGPLGVAVMEQFDLPWWSPIPIGVLAWGVIFGAAAMTHRSFE